MKKMLLFSFAAAAAMSAATAATDALAWDTGKPAAVFIVNGYQKVPVGTWILDLNQYTDYNGYEACSYFVKWIDDAYLPITANLFLDELVVPGFLDCELNACLNFHTVLFDSPGYLSKGFDKFQQKQVIKNLLLASDGYGMASGIIMFNTNFPYPFIVADP